MIRPTILYTTSSTFVVPNLCSEIYIICIGGGAPGSGIYSSTGHKAGASGAQCSIKSLDVAALELEGVTLDIHVAARKSGTSLDGGEGNDSYVTIGATTVCRAKGGIGSVDNIPGAGTTAGGIGDYVYKGGDGAPGGIIDTVEYGGGGGSAGGLTVDGNNAYIYRGGLAVNIYDGEGGMGCVDNPSGDGYSGYKYGGGGGGAKRLTTGTSVGGDGEAGVVIIAYTIQKGSLLLMFD
jgi:hypothetical protein